MAFGNPAPKKLPPPSGSSGGRFFRGRQALSYFPASAFLSFFTNSPDISVRMESNDLEQMDHMPATGQSGAELYFKEGNTWYAAAVAKASLSETIFTRSLVEGMPDVRCEYRLYLPLYRRVKEVELGFVAQAFVELAPAENPRPVFFYGTSITQRGCANTTGSDFVSQIGRMLNTEVINFGSSGNGKGEPEIASLISEIDAEMFVLDYAANVDHKTLHDTLPPFVSILRAKHPTIPIVLVGNIPYDQALWSEAARVLHDRRRDAMISFYIGTKATGDNNIHFIHGDSLIIPGQSGTYVDGVHPTSGGFTKIAERLGPQLDKILLWKRRDSPSSCSGR